MLKIKDRIKKALIKNNDIKARMEISFANIKYSKEVAEEIYKSGWCGNAYGTNGTNGTNGEVDSFILNGKK